VYNTNMSVKTLIRKPLFLLYTGGVLLLLVGGGLWWWKLCTDPQKVFWGMMEQNLSTRAVTIEAQQDSNGSGMRQTVQYSLGANNVTRTLTVITQPGTEVKNEMFATTKHDYTRYLSVKTTQKSADGKELDFSKVIGVWAKSDDGQSQLFPQAVLNSALPIGGMAVPIGHLDPVKRERLMKQILDDNAYDANYDSVKKQDYRGRKVYVYDVTIHPVAYAGIIKQFAKDLGLDQLDQLDPNTYREQPNIEMRFTVDVKSRRLVKVELPSNNYVQNYSSYDVPISLQEPKNTISTTELQKRLSDL
jgi:hypothetical protein